MFWLATLSPYSIILGNISADFLFPCQRNEVRYVDISGIQAGVREKLELELENSAGAHAAQAAPPGPEN